tara:strand:+ start:874 stop:1134 length:261 start_codon:yes stop_codon:yes gene_type:complete
MAFDTDKIFDLDHLDQDSLTTYMMALNTELVRFPNRWDFPSEVDFQLKSCRHRNIFLHAFQFSRATSSLLKSLSSAIKRSRKFKFS